MIQRSIKAWRRFRGDEDGSAMLIEFAILSPLLFGCLLISQLPACLSRSSPPPLLSHRRYN